jgi:enterochelin esterase family protein
MLLLALAPAVVAGEVRRGLSAPSPALGRAIPYAVYLPDGHGRVGAGGRPPILFLLHGLGGRETDWPDAGRLAPTLDRLIAEGAVPPLVVAMPGLGDGWYVDNPDPGGAGAVETAFLDDFVPFAEWTWGAGGGRDRRAVAGLSMGGWGAVRFAMLRPGEFAAAASLSGALVPDAWTETRTWAELSAGAFGRPADPRRFRAASPFGMIPAFAEASPRPALYLACGTGDELHLAQANRLFHAALREAGVEAELRLVGGGHDWGFWADELGGALRFVGAHLRGP